MKIIQSYWSKPVFHPDQNFENTRKNGGWLNIRYLYLSSCFSCLCAKRYYNNIELITDVQGKTDLIDWLNIPYDMVYTNLEGLQNCDHRLWVAGKLQSFGMQMEPFIHMDNDVYIWCKFPTAAKRKYLFAQSRIQISDSYKDTLIDVFNNFAYIPGAIRKKGIPPKFQVANAGIIGGNDVNFFQEYCDEAAKFLKKNEEKLSKINIGLFNTILDEYLFTCMVNEKKSDLFFLFEHPIEDEFKAIMRFNLVPFLDKYVHLIGFAKMNTYACEQIELRFEHEFPKTYNEINKKIEARYPGQKVDLAKDINRNYKQGVILKSMYSLSLEDLLNQKIKLSDNVMINEGSLENGDPLFSITVQRVARGNDEEHELMGRDELLVYFDSPVSINEMLEELAAESDSIDNDDWENQKFKLIDFVTEKMVIDGYLEFADNI